MKGNNMDLLNEAIKFAVDAHAGMVRKGTDTPFIVHPMEVASITAAMTEDIEVIAAAVLHDVAEDTKYTVEDIRERFGDRVAELVSAESENKHEDRPANETWKERKQETIDHMSKLSREAKIICLSDKLANLRSIDRDLDHIGPVLWERFNQKDPTMHYWYYSELYAALEEFSEEGAYKDFKTKLDELWVHMHRKA